MARILGATRDTFLARGYAGTTIDEITRVAGVSRASFYTYFPGKRDALLMLGADSASAALGLVDRLLAQPPPLRYDHIEVFVRDYFVLLDEHASFAFAWTQAAENDEEIRTVGMKSHLELCRRFGAALGPPRAAAGDGSSAKGLATFAMLERAWSYCRLYGDSIDDLTVQSEIARMLAASSSDMDGFIPLSRRAID